MEMTMTITTTLKNKSGIYAMPLLRNIGTGGIGREGWVLKTCPVCNAKCFELPQARVLKALGYTGMCTECMIKSQINSRGKSDECRG